MGISIKSIQSKIKSVSNVKKITKAMELVSVSKMKRTTVRATALTQYRSEVQRIHKLLVGYSSEKNTTLLTSTYPKAKKVLVVSIASNKGLCGGYNAKVIKETSNLIERLYQEENKITDVIAVGKYAQKIGSVVKKGFASVTHSFFDVSDTVEPYDIHTFSRLIQSLYASEQYYSVVIVGTDYISTLNQQVTIKQLLPIVVQSEGEENVQATRADLFTIEPSYNAIAQYCEERLFNGILYNYLVDAQASEHTARMMAMKNAGENANRIKDSMTLTYNRARQAAITQEIAEIASGADALSD